MRPSLTPVPKLMTWLKWYKKHANELLSTVSGTQRSCQEWHLNGLQMQNTLSDRGSITLPLLRGNADAGYSLHGQGKKDTFMAQPKRGRHSVPHFSITLCCWGQKWGTLRWHGAAFSGASAAHYVFYCINPWEIENGCGRYVRIKTMNGSKRLKCPDYFQALSVSEQRWWQSLGSSGAGFR